MAPAYHVARISLVFCHQAAAAVLYFLVHISVPASWFHLVTVDLCRQYVFSPPLRWWQGTLMNVWCNTSHIFDEASSHFYSMLNYQERLGRHFKHHRTKLSTLSTVHWWWQNIPSGKIFSSFHIWPLHYLFGQVHYYCLISSVPRLEAKIHIDRALNQNMNFSH